MKRIDLVIVGVLVVAAAASALGALTYEDARGTQTFLVTWSTRDVPLDDGTMQVPGAGEATWSVAVADVNLTAFVLELRVEGGAPRVQVVPARVEITPPTGEANATELTLPASPTGAAEEISIQVPIVGLPADATLEARSREEAIARAMPANATGAGVGEWTILVSISSGAPGPLAGTYTVSYTAIGRTINGSATPELPEVQR